MLEIHLQLQLDYQDEGLHGKSLLQAAVLMSNRDPVKFVLKISKQKQEDDTL